MDVVRETRVQRGQERLEDLMLREDGGDLGASARRELRRELHVDLPACNEGGNQDAVHSHSCAARAVLRAACPPAGACAAARRSST